MSQEFHNFSRKITPDIYQGLKRALELGKWPDGKSLSAEQRQLCMQAIISYEHEHLPEEQRTGYMPQQCKSKEPQTQPLNIIGNDSH